MARAAQAFEAFFCEIQVRGHPALPLLTRLILAVPAVMWILVGALGAALIVGKSYALAPKAAGVIDRMALGGLMVMIAAAVLGLFFPLVRLSVRL